jgi:NADPH:quinone reductase-like Zn-dependent oxidoreductase
MTQQTMRAIRQDRLGGPEVLELRELPRPEPGPTEVLVKVAAAGVNPVDYKTRARGSMLGEPPFTVGWDVAGTVAELGRGVTRFAVGDRVFGMPWFPREAGAYAEFVTAPSRQFAATPTELDDIAAAALPLASLTAWQALVDTARIGSGSRVLIGAAAGGVGHLAVQIAKAAGAHVIGTARAHHHELLGQLGADELIDYTTERVTDRVSNLDVVLDLVGGDAARELLPVVRDGGMLITVPSGSEVDSIQKEAGSRVAVTGILVEPDRLGIEEVARLAGEGRLRPTVARVFPLAEAAQAHALLEQRGGPGGKLVLTID